MKRAPPPPKPSAPVKAPAKSGGAANLPAPTAGEPVKYKFSPEDAEAQAAELIPADIQAGLADGQWKERLGAAEKLLAWVEEGNAADVESEVIFRYLCKTPGWNEKNFQVRGLTFTRVSQLRRSPGLRQGLHCDGRHGAEMFDFRQIFRRSCHWTVVRQARRLKTEETCHRSTRRIRREDFARIRSISR